MLFTQSQVQQDLMRPKSAMFHLNSIEDVAKDFVDYIKRERNEDLVVNDFLKDMNTFALEAILVVALDTKLGALKHNPGNEY